MKRLTWTEIMEGTLHQEWMEKMANTLADTAESGLNTVVDRVLALLYQLGGPKCAWGLRLRLDPDELVPLPPRTLAHPTALAADLRLEKPETFTGPLQFSKPFLLTAPIKAGVRDPIGVLALHHVDQAEMETLRPLLGFSAKLLANPLSQGRAALLRDPLRDRLTQAYGGGDISLLLETLARFTGARWGQVNAVGGPIQWEASGYYAVENPQDPKDTQIRDRGDLRLALGRFSQPPGLLERELIYTAVDLLAASQNG